MVGVLGQPQFCDMLPCWHFNCWAGLGAGVSRRMPLKGVAGVAPCPLPSKPLLAAYVPEAKGSPG